MLRQKFLSIVLIDQWNNESKIYGRRVFFFFTDFVKANSSKQVELLKAEFFATFQLFRMMSLIEFAV